jgi:hypothetical protein
MSANIISPLRSVTDNVASAQRVFGDGLLGKIFHDDASGGKSYRLVKCVNGDVKANQLVQIDVSEGNNYSVENCAATGQACGVGMAAMASASYGFVQVAGEAELKLSANATAGNLLVPSSSTAGFGADLAISAMTATAAARVCGKVIDSQATAGVAATVALQGLI